MGEAVLKSIAATRDVVARAATRGAGRSWRCAPASILAYVDRVNLSVAIIDADFASFGCRTPTWTHQLGFSGPMRRYRFRQDGWLTNAVQSFRWQLAL